MVLSQQKRYRLKKYITTIRHDKKGMTVNERRFRDKANIMAFGRLMFLCNFFLLSCFSFYSFLFMEHLKIGYLNVNGLRDRKNRL